MSAQKKFKDPRDPVLSQKEENMIANSHLSAISEMAGGIAHEINNPLAIIHGRAGILRMILSQPGQLDRSALMDIATTIEKTSLRIADIIRGLRHFARDGATDTVEEVTLNSIIDDVLVFCRERFKAHHIDLQVNLFSKTSKIRCRPVQISQVFLNLINNSFYEIRNFDEKWVRIDVSEFEDCFCIRVSDSGRGIPEHVRRKLFHPFFTTKPIGTGSGIGLSISKGIVESHSGTIELDESAPNTCFVIKLPKIVERSMS